MSMEILPAIDLIGGKCVRLKKGDYDKVTTYNDDPIKVALSFKEAGATWIHVVDLDAAKTGIPTNHEIMREIAMNVGLKVDAGGGIRNMETLKVLLEKYNVARAVLGTSAIKDPEFTTEALREYGERINIGIDAHDGMVATNGWIDTSKVRAIDFALKMKEKGATIVTFTDIARDGMMTGPAFDLTKELVDKTGLKVIASGGISCDEDVYHIKDSGAYGVIVGKAIYEGKVDLRKCIQNV